MRLIFLILIIVILLAILLFLITFRVKLILNTDEADFHIQFSWPGSAIKGFINIQNSKPILKLYLFNKVILKKILKGQNNKKNKIELVQMINPKNVHVNVQYGLKDPFATGITYGAISGLMGMSSLFVNVESLNETPDFLASREYIYLDATANVNLGSTLVRLIQAKSNV